MSRRRRGRGAPERSKAPPGAVMVAGDSCVTTSNARMIASAVGRVCASHVKTSACATSSASSAATSSDASRSSRPSSSSNAPSRRRSAPSPSPIASSDVSVSGRLPPRIASGSASTASSTASSSALSASRLTLPIPGNVQPALRSSRISSCGGDGSARIRRTGSTITPISAAMRASALVTSPPGGRRRRLDAACPRASARIP